MKLIACQKCKDVMMLVNKMTRTCYCGAVGGKYLDDNITAVVNWDAIVFGIDNSGFSIAKELAEVNKKLPYRYDYFFSGWIPTKPGEVLTVETVEDVLAYPYELPDELKEYNSTWPSRISEQHENSERVAKTVKINWWDYTKIYFKELLT